MSSYCKLCGDRSCLGDFFPFYIDFKEKRYYYARCGLCRSLQFSDMPDDYLLSSLYTDKAYIAENYERPAAGEITRTVDLICQHLGVFCTDNSSIRDHSLGVLDFGCGDGALLSELRARRPDLNLLGVEFGGVSSRVAHENSGVNVINYDEFNTSGPGCLFTVVHFGDVLEHVPEPKALIKMCLPFLVPGGFIIVRGPLEQNPSLSLLVSSVWGWLRFLSDRDQLRPGFPFHLFRATLAGMLQLVATERSRITLVSIAVRDDGWPYTAGTLPRRLVGLLSVFSSRIINLFGFSLGNRIEIILRKVKD